MLTVIAQLDVHVITLLELVYSTEQHIQFVEYSFENFNSVYM